MIMETYEQILLYIKSIQRKHKLMNQYCKKCGREMGYDYNISNEDWEKLPIQYHNKILCIHCFCKLHPDLENLEYIKLYTNWKNIKK